MMSSQLHKLTVLVKKTRAENTYYKEQNANCMLHLETMRQYKKEVEPNKQQMFKS